ncbi:hypothetical protein L2E82_50000 [Cichorium intybus]|nr:hypothetical protein L2E82_50000 [Cichorium intybus]
MVEETHDGCVEKEDGMVEDIASSDDGNDEDCDADNRTAVGDHGAKPVCGDPLSDAVISDQHLPHLKGPQMMRNGSIEGGSFYGHGRSAEKVPEQKTQKRKESLGEDNMFTGDREVAEDKRNTGAGALSGNWMRDDESEMVGDNHVGSLGDSLFGSQSHVQKGEIKVLNF